MGVSYKASLPYGKNTSPEKRAVRERKRGQLGFK